MFHKYNSFTNSLSTPSDPVSAYAPQSLGTKEATNNYFVTPQPKGREPGGSGPAGAGSNAGRQMSVTRFLLRKIGIGSSSVALTTLGSSSAATTAQAVASSAAQSVAANAQSVAAAAAKTVAATVQSAASTAQAVAASATQAVASSVSSQAASGSHAVQSHGHGHGHGSHAAPWEGVNLWRTPYKGDTDTITQVKRSKGTLDRFVEDRTRRLQQLQLLALRNKQIPTWVMMPRDKILFAAQGVIVVYVLYEVVGRVYQHLKAKDRLKLAKLLYKDNVD